MIYVMMGGRLGNQMFRYASARALSIENPGHKIILDFQRIAHRREWDPQYTSDLLGLNIIDCMIINDKPPFEKPINKTVAFLKLWNRIIKKIGFDTMLAYVLQKMMYPIFRILNVYEFDDFHQYKKKNKKNIYIYGVCESPKYFNNIKSTLMNEFTPHECMNLVANEFHGKVMSCESVCLSIRRWREDIPGVKKRMQVCTDIFYKKAIDKILETVPNATFFVFSDDVDWVKERFEFPQNTMIEPVGFSVFEKLKIMSSCKHFIIPNSTFAWWVQYLSDNPHKMVLVPPRWNNIKYRKNDLNQENFIIINTI